MRSIVLAVCLLVSTISGTARAESPPHRIMALTLTGVGVIALQRLAFHSPDPRIGYAYKSAEIEVITGSLTVVAEHPEAPAAVKQAILVHLKAMSAYVPAIPMSQLKMEHILDWQKKSMEELKKLNAALK